MLNQIQTSEKKQEAWKEFSLDKKFTQSEGYILLSGIQALVRLPIDQHLADKRRQLNTATFISGYRGSPLAGFDTALWQNQKLLSGHHVFFTPGVNEELGATAVFGSQIANMLPQPKYDGVLGMWYGKAPGVDRSGDVFKHANFAGVGRHGGVLAIAGDDPISKSSTLPSHSEVAFYDAQSPVLFPGNSQEVLDLGRLGFELSRYSGLWVGFKLVTNVADEFSTAEVSPDRVIIEDPQFFYNGKSWQHTQNTYLLTPYSLTMEKELVTGRLEAAKRFASTNGVNVITVPTPSAWLGIVAAGKTYYDMRQALNEMGLDEDQLRRFGIRLLKIGMLFPMDNEIVNEFAEGLEEIFVVEEKRSFIEMFIRDILYNRTERPLVVGKQDEKGNMLIPAYGELDPDTLVAVIAKRLAGRIESEQIENRLNQIRNGSSVGMINLDTASRSPFYCSGCPHNTSTVTPDGSLVAGGIGCHTMTLLIPDRPVIGITQMGGEGAQWAGASPFTDVNHIFQNIGDGTLFHSGWLAVRQAVASNVNITYKILYNAAVAMTGGQNIDGGMALPEMTVALLAEGVKRIIITTDKPEKYPATTRWMERVEVWHRDRIDEAQRLLRDVDGVTVLIHDQECAAELRRKRRRGLADEPEMRVFINEAVCEGCGDCGEKSNCLSVFPVETEFGRKTQIHQSSCNKDYSCLKGDCPAFVTVIPQKTEKKKPVFDMNFDLPAVALPQADEYSIYMMGIGGTGVVTTNQVLATAAMLDGKFIQGLDQTGLSQKGGPVVSNLKIMTEYRETSNRISTGQADCFLVFDLLSAVEPANMSRASKAKTRAIVSTSETPTGAMVISTSEQYPKTSRLLNMLGQVTNKDETVCLNANGLAEMLFDSHMAANSIMIGAAYQRGLLPISAEAIERAIELNGVSVKTNIQAFRVGRQVVANPDWVKTITIHRHGDLSIQPVISAQARHLIDSIGSEGDLLALLEIRIPELIAYQNIAYAQKYAMFVRDTLQKETARVGKNQLTEAVARYLYKLMAYKDEYEVARLHTRPEFRETLSEEFGQKAGIKYMLLPPILRAIGLKKKIGFGRWFDVMYGMLKRMKMLRGTPLDVFGYAKVRRVERQLPALYCAMITECLENLADDNYVKAVKLAELPDMIRGYEYIKLRNVSKFWVEVEKTGLTTVRP
ncbi:MAG: indolepyruvate ferredoxin oxidoreductase family protein [Phototrophicales bacterium]|nr:indolepyruvate ferredoxin oxidoreductase family protein [Phototrophicales bacterium]